LNFGNFISDIKHVIGYESFTHSKGEIDLDKDILSKHMNVDPIYSKDTCLFLPHEVNTFFTFIRDKDLTKYIGVRKHSKTGKYMARISKESKNYHLGYFDTPEEGYTVYKKEKIKHLRHLLTNKYSNLNAEVKQILIDTLIKIFDELDAKIK